MKLKILISSILFVYFLIWLLKPDQAMTQDLGRHIKLGEIITKCRCVPRANLFSFTQPDHKFINHHWLSEVVFYSLYKTGGILSILFLKIILVLISFFIILFLASGKAKAFWLLFFSPFYIQVFSDRFDSRPEIFSFLFLSIFLLFAYQYRKNNSWVILKKYFFILIFAEVLWVNMHIYFILGPVVILFLLLENILLKRKRFDRNLLYLVIAVALATLFNPNSVWGALLPFTVLQGYGYSIVENQNILFLNTQIFSSKIIVFEILFAAVLIGILFNFAKISFFDFALAFFSSLISFYQIRNFPVFVFFTLPLISYSYSLFEKNFDRILPAAFKNSITTTLLIIVFVYVAITVRNNMPLSLSYADAGEKAVDFLKTNQIKGPIFNNFDIGSYLIFRLYPDEKVFVDGRPEAYSVDFFDTYKLMQVDENIFSQQVEKYGINAIFFAHRDITPWGKKFVKDIIDNKQWSPVYLDDKIIILIKNSQDNKEKIDRLKINI